MSARLLTAAALLLGGALPFAAAKPPDLPADTQVDCRGQSGKQPTGSITFGVGISSDTGLTWQFKLEVQPPGQEASDCSEEAEFQTIDMLCPCLGELARSCWQSVVRCFQGMAGQDTAGKEAMDAPQKDQAGFTDYHSLEQEEGTPSPRERPQKARRAPPPKSGETHKAIEKALNAPISMDFKDEPLAQVINDLRDWTGLNIVPDKVAFDEEGISLKRPFTIRLEGVALKSALNLLLQQAQLTYVVKDEVLLITTKARARGKLVTKTYAVADLLAPDRDPPARTSKLLQVLAALYLDVPPAKDAPEDVLMKVIVRTTSPETWSDNGGPGAVAFFPEEKTLVVNQTPDVQEQVAELLAALRRIHDPEAKDEAPPSPAEETTPEPSGALLVPMLPPADPKVVDALEEVLAEAGDPTTAKFVIQVEDNGGAEEAEEEPVSQWPYTPPQAVMPSLYAEPVENDSATEDEPPAEEGGNNPGARLMPSSSAVGEVLRGVIEAVRAKTFTDVDDSRLEELGYPYQVEIGAVTFRLIEDGSDGWTGLVLSLRPEASGDLRTAQRLHDDRILHWIESLSGSGVVGPAEEEPDYPALDEEDEPEEFSVRR
jgi:hypothetical protein